MNKLFLAITTFIIGLGLGFLVGYGIRPTPPEKPASKVLTFQPIGNVKEAKVKAINEWLAKEDVARVIESLTNKDYQLLGKMKPEWYDLPYDRRVDIAAGFLRAWQDHSIGVDLSAYMEFKDHLGGEAFSYNSIGGMRVTR